MTATNPALGTVQKVKFQDIESGRAAILVFGFPVATKVDLGAGCEGWLDVRKPFLAFPWLQGAGTTHTLSLPVPNSTSLVGLYVGMQAVVLGTNAAGGLDLTNAVFEVFGG